MPARAASIAGAQQVWGAVLVSALTTVMVFIPILISKLEVGQLFRDIAVAISVSVLLSLLVSVTVIPALSRKLLGSRFSDEGSHIRMRIPLLDDLATSFVKLIMWFTWRLIQSRLIAFGWVSLITVSALFFALKFLPDLEYLPEGNNNLIFGLVVPPPGYNLETMTGIASNIENAIQPHWKKQGDDEVSSPDAPPKIERFFFVSTRSMMFVGAISSDSSRVAELIPVLQETCFPGARNLMDL